MSLPDTIPAESALIAALLDSGEDFPEAFEIVSKEDFAAREYSKTWEWMTELFAAALPVNMMTLSQRYSQTPEWRETKTALEAAPAGGSVRHSALILADKAALRRAVAGLLRATEKAQACATYAEARTALEGIVAQILADVGRKDTVHVREVVERIKNRIKNPAESPRQFGTGFPTLDKLCCMWGPAAGHLMVLAGRSGEGKSTMAVNILTNMAQNGVRVGIFSLEMDAEELTSRAIFSYARSHPDFGAACDKVSSLEMHIADAPDRTVESIRAAIRLMVMRHRVQVVAVDYLQLIGAPSVKGESRERQVANMSRQLKVAAKESGVFVMALSQLNEEGQLRESRAIQQDADEVVYVIKADADFYLWMTKNRHGKKHGNVDEMLSKAPDEGIPLWFDAENFRFTETERKP